MRCGLSPALGSQRMKKTVGTVQVYTGGGKGKTTAALGLALRALGHGRKVLFLQFMKGSRRYGEVRMARNLPGLDVLQYGRTCFVCREKPDPKDVALAQRGLRKARQAVLGRQYDLIVLDEINVAMDYGLIDSKDVLALLDAKPEETEIVLTGRHAPPSIRRRADLVSEIREVKHPWRRRLAARPGVEF